MDTTRTATGYRITFDKNESVLWTNLGRGFVHLMIGVWAPFSMFPLSPSGMKRYRFTLKLYQLAQQYLNETVRCHDNEAYFAAGVVGSAMIEAILILACVRDRDTVLQTRAWKAFAKKEKRRGKTFSELIPWIDFGNLLAIGTELGWFSSDKKVTEDFFAAYADTTDVEDVLRESPDLMMSPLQALTRMHDLRNFVHPGRCLRQNIAIEEEMAKLSAGLVYVSLVGVLDYYQGPPAEYIELEVPLEIRKRLNWSAEAESPLPALTTEISAEPETYVS